MFCDNYLSLNKGKARQDGTREIKIQERERMRHYVITGVLVIVVAIATYAGLMAIKLMPVEASAQSIPIDQLMEY